MGIVDDIKKDADKTFTKIQSTQEKEIEQMKTSWHCQIKQTHSKCLKCC